MNARIQKLMRSATLEEKALALNFLVVGGLVTESQLVAAFVMAKHGTTTTTFDERA